tara:strand:- start:1197 stop:1814 length:618 start_codon:yes stop_codon:yes gene_type:complete
MNGKEKENSYTNFFNVDPLILKINNFISNDHCDSILNDLKDKNFFKAEVIGDDGKVKIKKGRSNKTYIVRDESIDSINLFVDQLKRTFELESKDLTKIQVQKYSKKEKYLSHLDSYPKKFLDNESVSQRHVTFIMYLNEVKNGGETYFPLLDIKIKPEKGSLIAFENCFKNTIYTHPKSLHGSKQVLSGEKYILNFWSSKTFNLS